MKIVHLAVEAPYNEGWGYQENLLPKYQVKSGHDVTLIITNMENCEGGGQRRIEPCDYISPGGFRVIRLDYVHYRPRKLAFAFRYYRFYAYLKEIQPDFVMVHGLNNFSVLQLAKYVRKINPRCVVIADNHLDYNIGSFLLSKRLSVTLFRYTLRLLNRRMQKYYTKVYGVTPWRCEFSEDVYGIPKEKLDLFPAGADDEKVHWENRSEIRNALRRKHGISEEDFLIVTGGKIDERKNIDRLMEAVAKMPEGTVKLLVFGKCSESIRRRVDDLAKHPSVCYIGWISSDETYDYFMAADLVFFPGQHSVMWEQCVACGTPIVMKHFHAMQHCDIGGNAYFFRDDSVVGIQKMLEEILADKQRYAEALRVAQSDKRKQFLYSELSKKSLEVMEGKL